MVAGTNVERPDAFLVHDGVEVDIAAIAILLEERAHLGQCTIGEAFAAGIGDNSFHLAGNCLALSMSAKGH